MPRGKKPYISFETKEEFDKTFHEIFQSGYEEGFKRGRVVGLAHVLAGIDDHFDSEVIADADRATKGIQMKRWKQQSACMEGAKKLAVSEYIASTKGAQTSSFPTLGQCLLNGTEPKE